MTNEQKIELAIKHGIIIEDHEPYKAEVKHLEFPSKTIPLKQQLLSGELSSMLRSGFKKVKSNQYSKPS